MPSVVRFGDRALTGHGCSTVTSVIGGSRNVFVNGRPVERLGDPTAPHTIPSGFYCVPHTSAIFGGSRTVYVNGRPIARVGDRCDFGRIISGSSNVFSN